jgi:hypothetical protein
MRFLLSLFSFLLFFGAPSQGHADPQPRLAVIPYLTLNLTNDEERELREVLSLEIASNTIARVLSNKEVQKKMPPIPDGCPENPACVASVGTPLGADYLLFVALVKNDTTIDMQLFLVEVAGVGAMRQGKTSLQSDESTWNESIGGGVRSLLGGVKRLAKETEIVVLTPPTMPTSNTVDKTPTPKNRKAWPWFLVGGVVLSGAAAGALVVFYPFTTLDSFGPGVNQ